jgi:hypothetical protein
MLVGSETLSFSVKIKRKIRKAFSYRFDKMLTETCRFFVRCFTDKIKGHKYARVVRLRRERFIAFSTEHVVERDHGLSKFSFPPSFPSEFEFFALGGDQVWNPFFDCTNVPGTVYFLPFAGGDKRAFMFSTSFGVSKDAFFARAAEVPGLVDAYRDALFGMDHISCREDAGAEITNALAGRGEVLSDPTMILTREEWLSMARKPEFLISRTDGRKGYVLSYFLGDLPRALKKKIKKFCEDKNLALIMLNDPADEPVYVSDPAEFVYLVANAHTVYTDSFHGAVFSILFEIPFFVFERLGSNVNMLSRMDTLLRKFDIEKRLVKNTRDFCPEEQDFIVNFSKTRAILSKEREKAMRFLKTVFSEVENQGVESR